MPRELTPLYHTYNSSVTIVFVWINTAGPWSCNDLISDWTSSQLRTDENSSNCAAVTGQGLLALHRPATMRCYCLDRVSLTLKLNPYVCFRGQLTYSFLSVLFMQLFSFPTIIQVQGWKKQSDNSVMSPSKGWIWGWRAGFGSRTRTKLTLGKSLVLMDI